MNRSVRNPSRRTPRRSLRRPMGASRGPSIKNALNGVSLRCRPDPNSIVDVPWNSITLSYGVSEGEGISTLTVSQVVDQLKTIYTGITAPIEIRILQARIWETTGKAFSSDFFDLLHGDTLADSTTTLKSLDDTPGRNHWARLGYIWPKSNQNHSLLYSTLELKDSLILSLNSPPESDMLLHLNILWRVRVVIPPPSKTFIGKSVKHLKQLVEKTPEELFPPLSELFTDPQ